MAAKNKFNYELVRKILDEKKLTYQHISDYLTEHGIPTGIDTVKSWFRRDPVRRASPELPKVKLIGDFLGLTVSDLLLDFQDEKILDIKLVPVVGSASCGMPDINALQEYEEKVPCADDIWNASVYAVIANGDSMLPEFKEGDIIYCDPTADVLDGDFVHYQYHNESAIKFYREDKKMGMIYFVPLNPSEEFKTLRFRADDEECQYLKMVKVVGHHRNLSNNRQERIRMYGIGNLN